MKAFVMVVLLVFSVTSMAHIGRNKINHRWPHMLTSAAISADNSIDNRA